LESVVFEDRSRLERIEEYAFSESGLKSIDIPPRVRFIDGAAFVEVSLNSISVSSDNPNFRIYESFLEDFSGSTIYRYLGVSSSIVIPASVVVLGPRSFHACEALESVVFEDGSQLERIEEFAFSGSGLASISLPSSLAVLCRSSFFSCGSLESVHFESGSRIERIEEWAFAWGGVRSMNIPSSVTFIDGSAFVGARADSISVSPDNPNFCVYESFLEDNCGSTIYRCLGVCRSVHVPSSIVVLAPRSFHACKLLECVTFEDGSQLEQIEECAFSESGLKSIEIPPRVNFIDGSAFVDIAPDSISISSDNPNFRKSDSFLEDLSASRIYRYLGASSSIVIPASVVVLGPRSFYACESLETVIFEDGSQLERIEEFAFSGSGLRSISIPQSVVVLGRSSFQECDSLESVVFQSDSRLERIEESAFSESGLKSIEIPAQVAFIDPSALVGISVTSLSISGNGP
jgi:cellobiose-specific phosphotransferase system component IIB